jgi:basic membrane lipoprotein Med (substrate-binding protein (PBP1-ABC) superfamily)
VRADRGATIQPPLVFVRRCGFLTVGPLRRPMVLVVLAVVAGLGVWVLWPTAPAPRARQYLTSTACLLTDEQGLADQRAVPVWAGMQDASLASRVKVQFLPATGAVTAADMSPYLASLVQRHCDLIVAVGGLPVAAVTADAARYPNARFVAVGGGASRANVTTVGDLSPAGVRSRIGALVRAAVGG